MMVQGRCEPVPEHDDGDDDVAAEAVAVSGDNTHKVGVPDDIPEAVAV